MQIDSRFIYAIVGSLVTLLMVFAFKLVFLSNSLVPNTIVSTQDNCQDLVTEQQYEAPETKTAQVAVAKTKPVAESPREQTKEKDKKSLLNSCDEDCLESTLTGLISGEAFSKDDASISSDQANQLAALLKDDPSKLSAIEDSLGSLRDQNARDSILYVFSRLPDDQIQQVARKLSSSQNTRDRIDSLSLLESVSSNNFDAQSEIKQIISTEENPDILLKAIKISHSLDPDAVDTTTQARLSNLIASGSNESIRSAALITKTKIVSNDPSLQTDISSALSSSSKRFTEAGLQALDTVLNKQKRSGNNNAWQTNAALKKNVESIANDPNADPYTRVEALNLIQRHYR